jgi:pyruvate dehydrogenase complex dehydrogenase (E1) component
LAAIESLKNMGLVENSDVKKVISIYNLDPEKPNPIKV